MQLQTAIWGAATADGASFVSDFSNNNSSSFYLPRRRENKRLKKNLFATVGQWSYSTGEAISVV